MTDALIMNKKGDIFKMVDATIDPHVHRVLKLEYDCNKTPKIFVAPSVQVIDAKDIRRTGGGRLSDAKAHVASLNAAMQDTLTELTQYVRAAESPATWATAA